MTVVTRCQILRLKCTKFDFGWGYAPNPAGGAYSAPPDPLAGFKVSNKYIAVRKVATPLRELTCHTGSHSVTCHPTEVTFPPLPQVKLVVD